MVKIGLQRKRFSFLVVLAVVYAFVRVAGIVAGMSARMCVSGVRAEARCILEHYHPTPHRSEFIMFENSCCNLCS